MRTLALVGLGTVAALVGCMEGGEGLFGKRQQGLEALVPLQGCQEVERYVRDRLKAEVNRTIDQAIEQVEKQSYGCGGYGYGGYGGGVGYADAGTASPAPPNNGAPSSSSGAPAQGGAAPSGASDSSGGASSGASTGPSQTSGTNNQVAGVDEADFIKHDGKHIYVLANGALRILKSWPASEASELSKVPLEGQPRELFVSGDRLVVYVATPAPPTSSGSGTYPGSYGTSSSKCTYGYECVPSWDGTETKAIVFDVSNRAAPAKIREISLTGSLLSARRIGTTVHTVIADPPLRAQGLSSSPTSSSYRAGCDASLPVAEQKQAMVAAWEALRAENLAKIDTLDVRTKLPRIDEGGAPAVPECSGYFRPSRGEGTSFTSVVSFDMAGGAPKSATIVSDPGVVYASESALYMSVPQKRTAGEAWYGGLDTVEEASTVHEFRIGAAPGLTGYRASGVVKGRVLNQFALDEHEGHLRIATTSGQAPSDKAHSTMTVLRRGADVLTVTGKVDNIAPSEDIRSVRFDGSRGFVVTFKKTDPLYVFDLGNPTAPAIAGELKIPGFSTYMHMMDAGHLLTIGYDADDQGSFAWFQGVMLQIFDVTDMKNPRLAHKEVIGTRGSSSEALTNHLAFTYFAPKNLLALPMTICEGGSGGSYGTNMTFSGLIVYDVTAQGGFSLRGRVAHPNQAPTAGSYYDSSGCSSWWTQASSEVKRSVVMDDFVYSVSNRRVKVNALSNLDVGLAEVSLEN